MKQSFRGNRLFLAYFLFFISCTAVSANMADSFGFGAKAIGQGGAGVASVDDWTAAYFNLAGLAAPIPPASAFLSQEKTESAEKIKLLKPGQADETKKEDEKAANEKKSDQTTSLGFSYLFQISSMDISPRGGGDPQVSKNMALAKDGANYGAVQLGLSWDVRSLVNTYKDLPVRFGLALSIRDNGTIASVNDTLVQSYNFQRLGREAQRIMIMSGIGFQAMKNRLSIGIGTSALAGGRGKFKMDKVEIDPTGSAQIPQAEVQMDLTPAIAPAAGIMYRQLIQRRVLMIGLAYRGETYMELTPLDAEATTQLLAINMPLKLSVLDFFTPHTFTLGFSYFHDEALKVFLDTEFQWWSRFKVSETREIYMKKVGQSFDSFKNIFAFRLGSEVRLGKYIQKLKEVPLLVRAGIGYVPAFTPDQTGISNFLDNDKLQFSLGSSYYLPSNKVMRVPVELSLGLQWQMWMERESNKTVVDSYNPSYSYKANVFVMSLSAGVRF